MFEKRKKNNSKLFTYQIPGWDALLVDVPRLKIEAAIIESKINYATT